MKTSITVVSLVALAPSAVAVLAAVVPWGNVQAQESTTARNSANDHAIEAYLSDNSIQALYVRKLDISDSPLREVRAGFFYNESRDVIAVGDLLAGVGRLDTYRRFNFRVGARAYAAFLGVEDEDVFSVGVGGEAEYYFGKSRSTWLRFSAFYAPDITTFGVSDRVTDLAMRLETSVSRGTDVYVGYRLLKIAMPATRRADDGIHIGFRRDFAF